MIYIILLACFCAFPFILLIVDNYFKTSYSCLWFGWHDGKGSPGVRFDGCSLHSKCSKCGKEVMQDGQGNWF